MLIENVKIGSVVQNASLWTLRHSATHQKQLILFTMTNRLERLPVRQTRGHVKRTHVHVMLNLSILSLVRSQNTTHITQIPMAGILIRLVSQILMPKVLLTSAVGHFRPASHFRQRVDRVDAVGTKPTTLDLSNAAITC